GGGPIEGEHRALGPYRMGPSPAKRTFASALCDVSTYHEPTLIERGTDVHLNYPITAHRSSHSSRPGQGKHGALHPSSLRNGDEGRNQSRGFPERLYVGRGSGAPRTLRLRPHPRMGRRSTIVKFRVSNQNSHS